MIILFYLRIYDSYFKWNKLLTWNSSFDRKRFQDQFIKMTAHHSEFNYMLWKMEHGVGAKRNNNFGITTESDPHFRNMQNHYNKYRMKQSRWIW